MTSYKIYKKDGKVIAENVKNSSDKLIDDNITDIFYKIIYRWKSESATAVQHINIKAGIYESEIVIDRIFGTAANRILIHGDLDSQGRKLTTLKVREKDSIAFRIGDQDDTVINQGYITVKNLKIDGVDYSHFSQGIAINNSKYINLDNIECIDCIWKGIRISIENQHQQRCDHITISDIKFINSTAIFSGMKNSLISGLKFTGKIPPNPHTGGRLDSVLLVSMLERGDRALVENCRFENITFENMQIPNSIKDRGGNLIYFHGAIVGFQYAKNLTFKNIKIINNRISYDSGYGPINNGVQFEPVIGTRDGTSDPEIRQNIIFVGCDFNKTVNSSIIAKKAKCSSSYPVLFRNCLFRNVLYKFGGIYKSEGGKGIIHLSDTKNMIFDDCIFKDDYRHTTPLGFRYSANSAGSTENIKVSNSKIDGPFTIRTKEVDTNCRGIVFKCNAGTNKFNNTACQ